MLSGRGLRGWIAADGLLQTDWSQKGLLTGGAGVSIFAYTDMKTAPPWNVLFLCTGNSARSILAEALLNARGGGRFRGYSAGSRPAGVVQPGVLKQLERAGMATTGLRSKRWEEFGELDAPRMDLVITVCDHAAREACPFWPGNPASAHWGLADPAAVQGTEAERERAFGEAFAVLERRIGALVALPLGTMEAGLLNAELARIGKL